MGWLLSWLVTLMYSLTRHELRQSVIDDLSTQNERGLHVWNRKFRKLVRQSVVQAVENNLVSQTIGNQHRSCIKNTCTASDKKDINWISIGGSHPVIDLFYLLQIEWTYLFISFACFGRSPNVTNIYSIQYFNNYNDFKKS